MSKSPDCPLCGHPPMVMLNPTQAMCGNDDCATVLWNPSETPAHNRANTHVIDPLVRDLHTDPEGPTS